MPTNGIADGILYSVNGAPVFTYGMITLTSAVLAYITFIEAPDIPDENPLDAVNNPVSEVIPPPGITSPIPAVPELPAFISENRETPEGSSQESNPEAAEESNPEAAEESNQEAAEEPNQEEAEEPNQEGAEEPKPKEELPKGGKKTRGKKSSKKRKTKKSH